MNIKKIVVLACLFLIVIVFTAVNIDAWDNINLKTDSISATVEYKIVGEGELEFHDADQDGDNEISLTELLRIIQFFNSGGYHACPDQITEDGFCPGLENIL